MDGLIELVAGQSAALLEEPTAGLVQCHGDFHPKNIIVGRDLAHDPDTLYVSVIDFASSQVHHPAFDLGTLFAQLDYQLREHPAATFVTRAELLDTYAEQLTTGGGAVAPDLEAQLPLFELRALLSIASFLIKVGKGESPDMADLLGRALELESIVRGK